MERSGPSQTADANLEPSALRVLLWSALGSGKQYGGPGMSAYRLYSRARPGRFHITLAHGSAEQQHYDAFAGEELVRPYGRTPLGQLRFIHAGKNWIKHNYRRFDVMHGLTGFAHTASIAVQAARLGLPSVVKLAGHLADLNDKPGWRSKLGFHRRRRQSLRSIAGIICISQAIYDECLGYGFPESMLARIPNGVDTNQFRPAASEGERRAARAVLGWKEMPTVLWTGGITERKQPHLLVEAAGLLKQSGAEFQIAFVGPDHRPEYTRQMQARSRELGVEHHLHWHGFTTDMATCYRAADIFCLPSRGEGLANALLEAMATAVVPVVTNVSGMPDLVQDHQTGRLVEPDPDELASALLPLLRDDTLRHAIGRRAKELIDQRFSASYVLDAHESLFRRIIQGQSAAV